jgi:uncharacterized protein YidB (DUF937 family)
MGLFNGLMRGVASAGVLALVAKLVNDHGGLDGMANTLREKGLADAVHSWIGTGKNDTVTPQQMHDAIGTQKMDELAQQSGMTRDQVAGELSTALPEVMNRLSPQGKLPSENPFQDGETSVQDMLAGTQSR